MLSTIVTDFFSGLFPSYYLITELKIVCLMHVRYWQTCAKHMTRRAMVTRLETITVRTSICMGMIDYVCFSTFWRVLPSKSGIGLLSFELKDIASFFGSVLWALLPQACVSAKIINCVLTFFIRGFLLSKTVLCFLAFWTLWRYAFVWFCGFLIFGTTCDRARIIDYTSLMSCWCFLLSEAGLFLLTFIC